jgi:glutamyl-tRNA reductase
MRDIAPEVLSIAEACLGGLQGHSALLIGPEEHRYHFTKLLQKAQMEYIYEENTSERLPHLLPYVQLLISLPSLTTPASPEQAAPMLTAASIAKGCIGRRKPLLIFDLAPSSSVEELAGLLPPVCLYTPDDLRHILAKREKKAS